MVRFFGILRDDPPDRCVKVKLEINNMLEKMRVFVSIDLCALAFKPIQFNKAMDGASGMLKAIWLCPILTSCICSLQ